MILAWPSDPHPSGTPGAWLLSQPCRACASAAGRCGAAIFPVHPIPLCLRREAGGMLGILPAPEPPIPLQVLSYPSCLP